MKTLMKKSSILAAVAMTASMCSTLVADQIFSDTFEHGAPISNLNAKLMTDNETTYGTAYNSAIFQTRAPFDTGLGLGDYVGQLYVNGGNRSGYITPSANVAQIENYEFNIGYLMYSGSGSFGINARSTANSANGGFLMSWAGGTVYFAYVDNSGVETTLGTVTAVSSAKASSFYLTDIQVTVTGSYQQLSVDGVDIGPKVLTQSVYDAEGTENIRFYGLTAQYAIDLHIDNITAATIAIPEASTTVSLMLGLLAPCFAIGLLRRRRNRR